MADRASRYSCAAARSFGLGGGAAFDAALAVVRGAIAAPLGAATGALTAFTFLADRVDWGFVAGGAATFFSGAAETFFAGAAFDGALVTLDGLAAPDGAAFVDFLAGALALAAGAFFAAGFDDGFFAAGFFGAAFVVAFFARGLAALRAGDFFAAAMMCLPRPALVVGGFISVRGTLPGP